MPELIVLCGVSHSGKSTYAEELVRKYPKKKYVIISSDQIREELYGTRAKETKRVWNEFGRRKFEAISNKQNIILDACHISAQARWRSLQNTEEYKTKIIVFNILFKELERRWSKEKRLPFFIIKGMLNTFGKITKEQLKSEGYKKVEFIS